ncbi:MAG: hypothetical protein IJQ02_11640 [Oscillospiraceae bacterium]|nr:hypothetical protein [Oscillospiraceae bacterium]
MNKYINVMIMDGNRTVNWDFLTGKSVRNILEMWNFAWVPGTVRVNGSPVPEKELDTGLKEFPAAFDHPKRMMVTMRRPKIAAAAEEKGRENDGKRYGSEPAVGIG